MTAAAFAKVLTLHAKSGVPLRLTEQVVWDKTITVMGGSLKLESLQHWQAFKYIGKGPAFNFADMKDSVFDFRLFQSDPEAEGVLFSGESSSWNRVTGAVQGGKRGYTLQGNDLCKWHFDTVRTTDCKTGFAVRGFNCLDLLFTNVGCGGADVGFDLTEGGSQTKIDMLTCSGTKIPVLVTGGINVEAYGIVSEGAETVVKVTNASNYSIQRYRIADARGGTTGKLMECLKNGLLYLDVDRADNLHVQLEDCGTGLEAFTSGLTPVVSAKGKVWVDGSLQIVK